MTIIQDLPMEPLMLTYGERECALKSLRRDQQLLDSELFRLTELAKGSTDAANAREITLVEFTCVTMVITKLWRLHAKS